MKYLHLSEHDTLNVIPFAKGLQYQAAIISMEGGEFNYITSHEEIDNELERLNKILSIEDDDSFVE